MQGAPHGTLASTEFSWVKVRSASRCAECRPRNVGIRSAARTIEPWSINRAVACSATAVSRAALAAGLIGRSRCCHRLGAGCGNTPPRTDPASCQATASGMRAGVGAPIRVLAIGESTVSGIGVSCGDETVTAVTARALGATDRRPIDWRAHGFPERPPGTDSRAAAAHRPEPMDILVVALASTSDGLSIAHGLCRRSRGLVTAVRHRVGNAAVVIAGVAPSAPSRRCPGRCASSSAGARPHCRRQPNGSSSACRSSWWNDLPLRSSRTCSPPTASIPTRKRTSCGAKRLRRWHSRSSRP